MSRQATIDRFKANPNVSVLIIGAGINGAGTFRDLALQGIDVLMVDRGDYCSGTSATSSRMVHGGIRYLENGEFRLVREAVHERNRLIQNAPHYVKPLPTTIPIFGLLSGTLNAPLKFLNLLNRPSERGALIIKMGLMMYDGYTKEQGGDAVPSHSFIGRKESLQQYPRLNPDIKFTATYYDAAMRDAERIAIEVMLDGLNNNPDALALNYVSAVGAEGDSVTLRDEETGETFAVKPTIVINAAGPWIDFANANMGVTTRFIGGTKGSHLVLNHQEMHDACHGHEFFFENKDGRIVLIYPLAGRVIIGTSDIKIDDPDQARITDDEIDYFISFVKIVFPSIHVDRSHIVYTFTGVRPLPASDAKTTGQVSRDHENKIIEPGRFAFPIMNLVGGKWTSYRAFSEEVTNETLKRLRKPRLVSTAERAIGGGADYPHDAYAQKLWIENTALKSGVDKARVATLFDRYGTRAAEFAEAIAAGDDRPLANQPDYSVREIQHITEVEGVVHLLDLLQRRSLLAMMGHTTYPLVVELSNVVGDVKGWSDDERQAEIDRTVNFLAAEHNVKFSIPSVAA
jgi:glycerol-3-phosphate dehydrogenase